MQDPNDIKQLIGRWPSRKIFADEVGSDLAAVHKWAQVGRIPSGRQQHVVRAALARGFEDITPEWMLAVHALPEVAAKPVATPSTPEEDAA